MRRRPYPILLLARELGIGGCERDLAKLALGLDRTKYIPHAGCFREGFRAPELREAGIPITLFPVTSFVNASLWKGAWALRTYVRRHGIVLVHGFDVPGSIFGGLVGRLCAPGEAGRGGDQRLDHLFPSHGRSRSPRRL